MQIGGIAREERSDGIQIAADPRKLSIVFVTQDEPFYLPRFFETILTGLGSETKAILMLPPRLGKKSAWQTALKHLQLYGGMEFAVQVSRFAIRRTLAKLTHTLRLRSAWSVRDIARQHDVACRFFRDVNSEQARNWVKLQSPDLIISISAPQIFRSQLLGLASAGCINLHAAPLPQYQGLMPSFWALANGEKETAVTVHTMTSKIDEGEILAQFSVPIFPGDSLNDLISRSKEIGAKAVLATIADFKTGAVKRRPMDLSKATYFGFPTRKDRNKLFEAGHSFR